MFFCANVKWSLCVKALQAIYILHFALLSLKSVVLKDCVCYVLHLVAKLASLGAKGNA